MNIKYQVFFILLISISTYLMGQDIVIADTNFLKALIDVGVDTNNDGKIQTSEASSVHYLDVSNKGISDITGIEKFTNLSQLYCQKNQLTSLDVSKIRFLNTLHCYENQLTSLLLNSNNLYSLHCYRNKLSVLNLFNQSNLQTLYCNDNQLKTLDITEVSLDLSEVNCSNNQLTQIKMKSYFSLRVLNCSNNQLTSLNIFGTGTMTLDCSHNQLISLQAFGVAVLDCSNNQLTSLQFNGKEMDCSNNQLTNLDISMALDLEQLNCSNNQLTTLNFNYNLKLIAIDCQNNQLSDMNISLLAFLQTFDCTGNSQLKSICVKSLTNISDKFKKNENTNWVDCSIYQELKISHNSPLCEGESLKLSMSLVDEATYQWITPKGKIIEQQKMEILPVQLSDSGLYIVRVMLPYYIITDSVFIRVKPNSSVIIMNVNQIGKCSQKSYELSGNPKDFISFDWYFNNSKILSTDTFFYVPKMTGVYHVIGNTINHCSSGGKPYYINLTKDSIPVIVYDKENQQLIVNKSEKYQWYINDMFIVGNNDYQLPVFVNGVYKVMTTNLKGCTYMSPDFVVQEDSLLELSPIYRNQLSLKEFSSQEELFIAPNPINDNSYLYLKYTHKGDDLQIIDMYGRIVYEQIIEVATKKIQLPQMIQDGIYIIRVIGKNHIIQTNFIKSK